MIKSKVIYIVVGVIVLAVVGGGLYLSKNKTTKNEAPASPTQSTSTPSSSSTQPAASANKVEEAYIELLAQTTYYTQKNDQKSWTAQNENDLFAKYGVTKEEVDAFSKSLRNDPARAKAVTVKQLQRLQELQKTGN